MATAVVCELYRAIAKGWEMIRRMIRFFGGLSGRADKSLPVVADGQSVCVVEEDSPIVSGCGTGLVTREALGIETLGGVFTPLIPTGTPVPCAVTERFATAANRQTEISVGLYRGNNSVAHENYSLGKYSIVGIRPGRRGESQVSVTFHVSEQGQVSISAEDARTLRPIAIRRAR
jgi:molecular chaperone DnaK